MFQKYGKKIFSSQIVLSSCLLLSRWTLRKTKAQTVVGKYIYNSDLANVMYESNGRRTRS